MMITIEKAIDLYLAALETEGRSPRYIGWLRPRLMYFNEYIHRTNGENIRMQDLTVDEGVNSDLLCPQNREIKLHRY
jgi:hypothetical protein